MAAIVGSKTEFLIDGVWTDYTSRIRGEAGISITNRGAQDQSSANNISAAQCDFTINNRDGLFSNRNPSSALYGKFPINTKVRHSVPASDNYVRLGWPSRDGTLATADKASLDITGDIDIRVELTPDTWRPSGGYALAGKGGAGTLAWAFYVTSSGSLVLVWTTDGVTSFGMGTTAVISADAGRLAVRATLDVNVAGVNRTAAFYTSDSLTGIWTLLGSTTTAGITSIFANGADLEVGAIDTGGSIFAGQTGTFGKIHGFELYNGISGTLVARMDPKTQTLGSTSWSDGLTSPNTWTLSGNARVTSDRVRFVGAMRRLPTRWDATGRDVFLPVSAQGPIDALTRNNTIRSAIYRRFIQYPGSYAYWPMEAANGATSPDFTGTANYSSSLNDISFSGSTPAGLAGSSGAMTLNSSASFAYMGMASPPASTGTANFVFYFKLAALPASSAKLITLGSNGTAIGWTIEVSNVGFTFSAYDNTGSVIATGSTTFGTGASPLNQWIGMQLLLTTEGANVRWQTLWHAVGTTIFYSTTPGGVTYAGSTGRFQSVRFSATESANFAQAQIAHAMIGNDTWLLNTSEFAGASKGYDGEAAGTRIQRLAAEEALSVDFYGDPADTYLMGPQTPDKVINLFQSAAAVDGGLLAEARDDYRLTYTTRVWLGLVASITVPYDSSLLSQTPEVIDDDRYVVNDASISRPDGSTRRSVVTEGPNSTAAPPDGVGPYPTTSTVAAYNDDQLQMVAARTTFIGTWDEPRIPQLTIEMQRSEITTSHAREILALDIDRPITISDWPSFMPPNDITMLVIGYTELIGHQLWTLSFNTTPRGPYVYVRLNSPEETFRLDTEDSTLDAGINSSVTSLVIRTAQSPFPLKWVDSVNYASEFPVFITIAGEEMVLTACTVGAASGGSWLQTATVTRSGTPKAHLAGEAIHLSDPVYLGA